jgi:ribosomal protein L24E
MPKCSYCNKEYSIHKGVTVVDSSSGNINYYCSSKCRKNSERGRKKKKWTKPKKSE